MPSKLRAVVFFLAALASLQTLDYLLTWRLLDSGVGYEANPLARYIIEVGGFAGLALFKFSITLLILTAAFVVARYRPIVGVRLLAGLCLFMLGVNVYSGALLASGPKHMPLLDSDDRIRAEMTHLDSTQAHQMKFVNIRERISQDLLAGTIDEVEALRQLADLLRQYGPLIWKPAIAALPDPDRIEEVAAYLEHNLATHLASESVSVRQRLTQFFSPLPTQIEAGQPLPPPWKRVSARPNAS